MAIFGGDENPYIWRWHLGLQRLLGRHPDAKLGKMRKSRLDRQIQLSPKLSWWRKWAYQAFRCSFEVMCRDAETRVFLFWGEESCESASEAKILSSLPPHINIIGQAEIFDFCWGMVRVGNFQGWQSFAAAQRFQVTTATFARWKEIRCEEKVWQKIDPNVIMTEMIGHDQELHDHHHDHDHDHGNHHSTHASHAHAVTHAHAHYL